ncbi:MAG: PQQ-binding-like beta-propeller repeat protein [Tenericutes bacterium]|nr:PQQ-binding-like beta-propeller repeat protein [Mycoplasmatota bacterium]
MPPSPEVMTATYRAIPYTGFSVTITKPDNSAEVLGPFSSDSTGSYATIYHPNQIGTYTFQFSYPGESIYGRRLVGDPMVEDYYKPSNSQEVSVVVQQEPIESPPQTPLPDNYWSRPINSENWEWSSISGNWLGVPLQFATGCSSDGNFNPYTTSPNTGHILYTMPHANLGLVGGEWEQKSYYTGLSYQEKWNPPSVAVLNGRLYYHKVAHPAATRLGVVCVDIRTGDELWYKEDMQFSFAQLWEFDTPNAHGINAYLWDYRSGVSTMYDANSGTAILQVQGCRTGKVTMSEKGDVLVYTINSGNSWMTLWNSSKALRADNSLTWSPNINTEYQWADGLEWNVTVPEVAGQTIVQVGDGVLFTAATDREANPPSRIVTGYDASTGENIWQFSLEDYTIRAQYNFSPIINGHFAWYRQETLQWQGFNAYTGDLVWGPIEPLENSFALYSAVFRGGGAPNPQTAYGNIYTAGYDGRVHAINMETGEITWDYYTGEAGFETFYGHYPIYGGPLIADNKIFVFTNEHTPQNPQWRGAKIHAMDAQTGEAIWNMSGWMPGAIIADGILVGLNYYDGQIYAIGKGPSVTSVSAAPKTLSLGSMVLIEGSILDASPGTTNYDMLVLYPHGVPAVADEHMSAWMEHLYMQKPRPDDVTGVPVKIEIVDPNNEYAWIGTATTDVFGNYAYSFKPQIEGQYMIIATFDGSESYYSSSSTTYIHVAEGVSPTTPIDAETPEHEVPVEPSEHMESLFITTEGDIIAVVAVAAVIGIAAYWFLKRK